MTDKNTLDLARQWAADIDADRQTLSQDTIDAAADLISSLPDAWIDADKVRELLDKWATNPFPTSDEVAVLNDVESLLPVPPAPRPEDVPEFDPGYICTDRDGREWEHLDGRWITGDTHAKRVAERKIRPGHDSLPEAFGPYTQIEA